MTNTHDHALGWHPPLAVPYINTDDVTVWSGDCLDVLRHMADNSVDAVVTDPPYGLTNTTSQQVLDCLTHWVSGDRKYVPTGPGGFMGKTWDNFVPPPAVWDECLRVLKPGGHLLAFAGSRTHDLMGVSIRLAGFEVRDSIAWLYGCHDDSTEILTRRGWVNGLDLRADDDVAQWATDGTVTLVRPSRRWRYPFDGRMVRFRNADVDQLVTPNHRVYRQVGVRQQVAGVRRQEWSDWQVDEAATINRWERMRLPAAGVHDGPGIGGTDYAALLGWVWAEGGSDLTGTGVRVYQSSVNQPHVEEIAALLDRLGPHKRYDYARTYTRRNGQERPHTATTWYVSGDLAKQVRADLPGKTPTWDLLWRMTADEKRALWDAAMKGDGSKGQRAFWQKDRATLEWAQALLAGIGCRGKVADDPRGVLHWTDRPTVELQRRHLTDDGEDYTGEVWCVTVPSGAFLVRRNGRVSVSGNSGFPKSLDVSKAIDKQAGAAREVVATSKSPFRMADPKMGDVLESTQSGDTRKVDPDGYIIREHTAPATDAAARWSGWGTSLKPAFEPIVVARKPLSGTVASNVQQWGTGALNIDACRVAGEVPSVPQPKFSNGPDDLPGHSAGRIGVMSSAPLGRWPANVALDDDQAAELDRQSGTSRDGVAVNRNRTADNDRATYSAYSLGQNRGPDVTYGGEGGASRFFPTFRYQAKAPSRERPSYVVEGDGSDNATTFGQMKTRECKVCGSRTNAAGGERSGRSWPTCGHEDWAWVEQQSAATRKVAHETVKPLELIRWLVRLVTPPGGVVLEPFAGSGTTVEACILEGFRCVAVERDGKYLPLVEQRVARAHRAGVRRKVDREASPRPASNGREGEASADSRYTGKGGTKPPKVTGPVVPLPARITRQAGDDQEGLFG